MADIVGEREERDSLLSLEQHEELLKDTEARLAEYIAHLGSLHDDGRIPDVAKQAIRDAKACLEDLIQSVFPDVRKRVAFVTEMRNKYQTDVRNVIVSPVLDEFKKTSEGIISAQGQEVRKGNRESLRWNVSCALGGVLLGALFTSTVAGVRIPDAHGP